MKRPLWLFVVWLPRPDAEAPVDLLQQDNAHQLVRESHFGERKLEIGAGIDLGRSAEGTADHKDDVVHAADVQSFDLLGEFRGGELLSADRKQDHICAVGYRFQYAFALGLTDLLLRRLAYAVRCLLILYFLNLKLAIFRQPFAVLGYRVREILFFDFSYTYNCDLQCFLLPIPPYVRRSGGFFPRLSHLLRGSCPSERRSSRTSALTR